MTPLSISYDLHSVALSLAISIAAFFVSLDVCGRIRSSQDVRAARPWLACGAMVMGTGIWAMHFIGMSAAAFPFQSSYDGPLTFLSWFAAIVTCLFAMAAIARGHLSTLGFSVSATTIAAGVVTMHYVGMAALDVVPGITYNPSLFTASIAAALVASAGALYLARRTYGTGKISRFLGQLGAATVMGLAVSGMHYIGMAATDIAYGTICGTEGELSGDQLKWVVALGVSVGLLFAWIMTGTERRTAAKADSLKGNLDKALEDLRYVTFNDPVTRLPNRLVFEDRLAVAVARADRNETQLALLFFEFEELDAYDAAWGSAFSNEILVAIASRLSASARASETVARVGGNQFFLLAEDANATEAAMRITASLFQQMKLAVSVQGKDLPLKATVGISLYPTDGPAAKLVNNSAAALAVARTQGSRFSFFATEMGAKFGLQQALLHDLSEAAARAELELFYQPKIELRSGICHGAEALVRWRHPVYGMQQPGEFIPLAETFGLMNSIGRWVLDEACRQMAQWKAEGLSLHLAVNLSTHQLRQPGLDIEVATILAKHDVSPRTLTLEITESAAMANGAHTLAVLESLDELGVSLSIDDFGTGYSNLSYLRRLPVGQLKIDRSFVSDLETSADACQIVEAVLNLSHALRLEVVAEGVETAAQRDILDSLGCDSVQGYLFAKPMPAADFIAWVKARASSQNGPAPEQTSHIWPSLRSLAAA